LAQRYWLSLGTEVLAKPWQRGIKRPWLSLGKEVSKDLGLALAKRYYKNYLSISYYCCYKPLNH
jgi:hypothetical protein